MTASASFDLAILTTAFLLIWMAFELLVWAFSNERRKHRRLIERINQHTGGRA